MHPLYKIVGRFLRVIGLQNLIILEAEPTARENTQAVYREMLRRGWNKRYRIALVTLDPDNLQSWHAEHVMILKRVQYDDSQIAKMYMRWISDRACMIIDENRQIERKNPKAIHVYLTHGSPIKCTSGFYFCKPDTDYSLCQSEFFRPKQSYEMKIPENKLVLKGIPRNDLLINSTLSLSSIFGDSFQKVIVWYPTYRQHRSSSIIPGTEISGLPIVHDENAAKQINEIAAKYGVLLVVKPHPAQDLSRIKALRLDHLMVITDDFFVSHGISSYAFLGKADALITDYSSVIYDYLLTGKPVALAQEDYEEYEKKVGFAIDMNLLRDCCVTLETADDFDSFFRDLIEGNDPLREKRDKLMHLTNHYTDGNSAARVVDWLETLLK